MPPCSLSALVPVRRFACQRAAALLGARHHTRARRLRRKRTVGVERCQCTRRRLMVKLPHYLFVALGLAGCSGAVGAPPSSATPAPASAARPANAAAPANAALPRAVVHAADRVAPWSAPVQRGGSADVATAALEAVHS